jgi:hypothetical protein
LMLLLHGTKLKLSSERLCSWFVKVKIMKEMIIDDTHEHLNRSCIINIESSSCKWKFQILDFLISYENVLEIN